MVFAFTCSPGNHQRKIIRNPSQADSHSNKDVFYGCHAKPGTYCSLSSRSKRGYSPQAGGEDPGLLETLTTRGVKEERGLCAMQFNFNPDFYHTKSARRHN